MNLQQRIRMTVLAAALASAGCSTTPNAPLLPLGQDDLDRFLASGRDAREYGITTYHDAAGPRFEFANRPRPSRTADMPFAGPRSSPLPLLRAKSGRAADLHALLDTSARQSWLRMEAGEAMDYRVFSPPLGEYPDHVDLEIPGYAGVANKLVFAKLHVESPIFYVPPARGGLGALARVGENEWLSPKAEKLRDEWAAQTHAVVGAAALRPFSFVRFDFPNRSVLLASDKTYAPAHPSAVRAVLPLRDWRGRPAIHAVLGGDPILLVLDTAGDFDLSLPADVEPLGSDLRLGDHAADPIVLSSHEEHRLPAAYPARLGLGVLARYALTLDFKNKRAWFEGPPPADLPATPNAPETDEPVRYIGVRP
jgi:hypothetical protein